MSKNTWMFIAIAAAAVAGYFVYMTYFAADAPNKTEE